MSTSENIPNEPTQADYDDAQNRIDGLVKGTLEIENIFIQS